MTEINRGIDRVGRRAKLFLSPSQKYKIWLQLIRQEVTIAEAAEQQHVDPFDDHADPPSVGSHGRRRRPPAGTSAPRGRPSRDPR